MTKSFFVIASEHRERGNPALQPAVLKGWIATSRDALLAMTADRGYRT